MDYRCPVCRAQPAKRRLSQAVVARMEIDCSHCKSTILHDFHWAEDMIGLLGFGTFVVLVALAYRLRSQPRMLLALGTAMVSAGALPLLERTYLRNRPRHAAS